MQVNIQRLNPKVPLPGYATNQSAAFDFAAAEDCEIPPKQIKLIPTGLVIEPPQGFFLAIFSRSSTPLKKGLSQPHSVGVLDRDYCGPEDEVKIMVYNFTDQTVAVKQGERIAQGIFLPTQQVEWQETSGNANPSRGGFGSSGQ